MDLATYARETGIGPQQFRDRLAAGGLDVTKEIVRRWMLGKQAPGVKTLAAIEAATDGKVTRHELRPDIFRASAA